MNQNEQVVRKFIGAWSRLDPSELASFFTEDGVYHNMPIQPVQGKANIEKFIQGFTTSWTDTTWEIQSILCADNLVIAERIDRTHIGNRSIDLPCVGVFELDSGKIKVWRDYFDLLTYQKALE
ncbi:MAG: nuclear transport factor 2 family protein [Thermodesulfobacteriota bacterium]|nr:nuclear transport factor 2 family protein [Thermodesulfobacteriota bacterium]